MLIASFLLGTTTLLWTAALILEFALATIKAPAAPVVAEDAAGKKHERETDEDAFGCFHLKISFCASANGCPRQP